MIQLLDRWNQDAFFVLARAHVDTLLRLYYTFEISTAPESIIKAWIDGHRFSSIPSEEKGETDPLWKHLGKHVVSGGCLHIDRLSDVDLDVLGRLFRKSFERNKEDLAPQS